MRRIIKIFGAVLFSLTACFSAHSFSVLAPLTLSKNFVAIQQGDNPLEFIAKKWRAFYQPPGGDQLVYTIDFTKTGQATLCIAPARYPDTCQGKNYFSFTIAGNAGVGGALQISYHGIRSELCSQGCMPAQRPADFTARISILSAREFTDGTGLNWTAMAAAF